MVDVVGLRFVNEGLNESLQGLQQHSRAVDRATQSMKVAANQSNANAKSLDRLNRDVLKAENEMRRLAQAMQRGAVTGAQFQGEVNRIAARLRNLGMDRAQAETMKFARAQADLARETQQAGNAIVQQSAQVQTAMRGQAASTMFASRAQNASGMAMQQVGYQVGDFLVQVQSGTNAMVAFGQQATQLVGVLPMFGSVAGISGTSLIALTAALGIAIPLFTAAGAAIMRMRETAGNADEAFKDLGSTLNDLDSVRLDNLNGSIADGARAAAAEYERVLMLMERVEARALQSILRNQATAVEAMIRNQRTLQSLAAQTGVDFNFEVMGLDSFNEAIFLATQLRTLTGETREELLQQVTAIEEALSLRGLMNPQVEALVAKLAEEVGLIEAADDAVDSQNEALAATTGHLAAQVTHQQQIATLQMTINERREAYRKTVDDANRSIEDQISLNMAILQFGEDSQQVEAVRATQAREAYRQQQLAAGIVGNHLKEQMRLYDISVLLAKAIKDSADSAEDLSDEIASTDLSSLASQAAMLASNMGVAADEAARYNAALNRQAGIPDNTGQPRLGFGGLGSMENGPGLGTGFARLGFGNLDEPRLRTRTPMATPAGRGGGGGGGGAAAAQDDYLQNLLDEAEQKRRLVGLTEEETRRQEILFELKKRELPLGDERIEQIIKTEAETRKLIEAEQRREQMMQTIEGHIENAFMTMVDGSASVEDAFRNMLRNILLAIYQQKVAEPAAEAIGGLLEKGINALFSANGNVFSGGSRVTAYANGGVVNSPTYFPMTSGVGLMGEAGPEAIMPLKRGANGKLGVQVDGNAGNVTVNQYFNIAANGDESVRRIVRQETPRIAEQAKAAVVDAKRRGGAYGRSF